jgi:hypothetical protein
LEFDVVWINEQFLDVNLRISKSLLSFHPRAVETLHEADFVMRGAHPATAAPATALIITG